MNCIDRSDGIEPGENRARRVPQLPQLRFVPGSPGDWSLSVAPQSRKRLAKHLALASACGVSCDSTSTSSAASVSGATGSGCARARRDVEEGAIEQLAGRSRRSRAAIGRLHRALELANATNRLARRRRRGSERQLDLGEDRERPFAPDEEVEQLQRLRVRRRPRIPDESLSTSGCERAVGSSRSSG